MRIGIEAQRLFRPKKHGMEIVTLEIVRQLASIDLHNEYELFIAADTDVCMHNKNSVRINLLPHRFYPLWEQFSLPKAAQLKNVDLLHCTANTAPLWYKKPMVVTIHDVIYLETLDFSGSAYQNFGNLYRRFIVPRIAKKAKRIITVSEYAKKIISKRLGIAENKINVVYNGVHPSYKRITDVQQLISVSKKYQLPEKFLLHFGNTASRKNTSGVLKAYKLYKTKNADAIPLVITGIDRNLLSKFLQSVQAEELADQIILPGYIAAEDLPALYNLAHLFLYPSLNEGFGMPVIEAMACGTPVITSTVTSLPEVAGNAAMLVDPTNEKEICEAIETLTSQQLLYNTLQMQGFMNAQRFSWETAARKTIAIYKALTA